MASASAPGTTVIVFMDVLGADAVPPSGRGATWRCASRPGFATVSNGVSLQAYADRPKDVFVRRDPTWTALSLSATRTRIAEGPMLFTRLYLRAIATRCSLESVREHAIVRVVDERARLAREREHAPVRRARERA